MSKSKRKTIGANPLDAVIPFPPTSQAKAKSQASSRAPQKTTQAKAPQAKAKKQRLTVHVTEELSNRVKNAVYWTPGLTLASLAEDALSGLVDQLEKERGGAFPQRTAELKGGRPLK